MRYRFGPFVLDEEARQLERRGVDLAIPARAFDLLATLIRRRPEIVPGAELMRILWPNTSPSRGSLDQLVEGLRMALGDHEEEPLWIRRAGARGFVFAGDAREGAAVSSRTPALSPFLLRRKKEEIPLREGENLLGRTPEAVVRFESMSASRKHARIVVSGPEATIEDLDSRNGTFVWRQRVEGERPLAEGDRIRICGEDLVFERSKTVRAPARGARRPARAR